MGFGSGEKPQSKSAAQKPLETLGSVPGYSGLFGRTESRSQGAGLGIDPRLLQRSTSSLAAQEKAFLGETTLPGIKSVASGAGVGRSTIPSGQFGLAAGKVGRNIEERLAGLTIQNEQEKIRQRELADRSLYSMIGDEANIQNLWRQNESEEFDRIQGYRDKRDAEAFQAAQRNWAILASVGDAFMNKYTGVDTNTRGVMSSGGAGGSGSMSQVGGTGAGSNSQSSGLSADQITQIISMFG